TLGLTTVVRARRATVLRASRRFRTHSIGCLADQADSIGPASEMLHRPEPIQVARRRELHCGFARLSGDNELPGRILDIENVFVIRSFELEVNHGCTPAWMRALAERDDENFD